MIEQPDKICRQLSHGVYIIGVSDGDRKNAFTAAWVMQVSFDPLLICFSINPHNYSWQLLQQGKVCSINVLGKRQHNIAEHFGQSKPDKMNGFDWKTGQSGAPILCSGLSYFDCKIRHFTDAGDHKLAICEVLAAGFLNPGELLLYNDTGNMDGSSELFAGSSHD